MANIEQITMSAEWLIDEALEAEQPPPKFGTFIGPSALGEDCERSLWYLFHRYVKRDPLPAKMIRIFATGNEQEERMAEHIRRIAVVKEEQAIVRGADGHVFGMIDGEVYGFPGVPLEDDAILEIKSHNQTNFNAVMKHGIKKKQPKHWAQMHLYGHLRSLDWYVYAAVCKNTERLWFDVGKVDHDFGNALLTKATRIVRAIEPPPKISDDPDSMDCMFCPAASVCHFGAMWEVNERNDGTMMPGRDGVWESIDEIRTKTISTAGG